MAYTEGYIQGLLAQKYCAPEWAYFSSVPDSTGGGTRIADGVAMNLYPSKKLALTCFEIKVSRSDLMAELRNITKSECVGKYCDYFVLVVPKGIVSGKELPDQWGILEVCGDSFRTYRKPKQSENVAPLDRGFVASLLRRASEGSVDSKAVISLNAREAEIAQKIQHYESLVETNTRNLEYNKKAFQDRLADLNERERAFTERSGLFAQRYSGTHLIPVFLELASKEQLFSDIAHAHARIRDLQEVLGKIVDEYQKVSNEALTAER